MRMRLFSGWIAIYAILTSPTNAKEHEGDAWAYIPKWITFVAADCCPKKEVGGEVYLLATETTGDIDMGDCVDGCAYRSM